jgi:hypothetical protein
MTVAGEPPRIDVPTAMTYRRDAEKVLAQGEPAERKRLLRIWIEGIKLAPETREVEITYRLPEPVMHEMVAGARYELEKKDP